MHHFLVLMHFLFIKVLLGALAMCAESKGCRFTLNLYKLPFCFFNHVMSFFPFIISWLDLILKCEQCVFYRMISDKIPRLTPISAAEVLYMRISPTVIQWGDSMWNVEHAAYSTWNYYFFFCMWMRYANIHSLALVAGYLQIWWGCSHGICTKILMKSGMCEHDLSLHCQARNQTITTAPASLENEGYTTHLH